MVKSQFDSSQYAGRVKVSATHSGRSWAQHLGKLPLPIEQQQHLRLRRILGDSRRTWREIAEAIESSPSSPCRYCAKPTTEQQPQRSSRDVETALSRLGLSRCEALLSQAPALPESDIPLAFKQILPISQHASQHPRCMAEHASPGEMGGNHTGRTDMETGQIG